MRDVVIITGAGRAGTSFLVQLLTHLGIDTGYKVEDLVRGIYPVARAGLERRIEQLPASLVVKTPWYCDHMEDALNNPDVKVRHVLVPMRNADAAAASRVRNQTSMTGEVDGPPGLPGALWRTNSAVEQPAVIREKLYGLLECLVEHDVPTTFLWYPRLTTDPEYLRSKLVSAFDLPDPREFKKVFERVVRPELVSSYGPRDR